MIEQEMFTAALNKEDPVARATFLDEACAGDVALRRRVESLLADHRQLGSFMDVRFSAATFGQPHGERVGDSIGPYKLREMLGEGGMGNVYVAEQEMPIRRKVALKIIKPGMDSREVLARFEAERQAIALMDHPNIAKILEANMTESGRPYFVMELVRGVPITDFCDQRRLNPRQRLELFVQVCRAIQHAHQKGIIHRDIKPSNILVTLHDDLAVPKVIDFGIAKATGQRLTEHTVYTAFNQMIGTPLYMSPEQAEMNALDIDTRSDVYSLGVLLYELLTGGTPFDGETLKKAGLDEIRRIIREVDPPSPSQRLHTLDAQSASTVSTSRGMDERQLCGQLQRDLDWIVMCALEKDRNRRYESASAMATDVQRHLDGDAVEACPISTIYRLQKFLRRNTVAIATAAVVIVALVAGTGVSIWQAVEANGARNLADERLILADERLARETAAGLEVDRQRKEAEVGRAQARRAVDDMYMGVAETWLVHQSKLTDVQRGFLEKALVFYQDFANENRSDPLALSEAVVALKRVGAIQKSLGNLKAAEAAYRQSITLGAELAAKNPGQPQYRLELGKARLSLAYIYTQTGRDGEADQEAELANKDLMKLDVTSFVDPQLRRRLAAAFGGLCDANASKNQQRDLLAASDRAFKIWESLVKESPSDFDNRRGLANHYCIHGFKLSFFSDHYEKAEEALQEAETRLVALLNERPDDREVREQLALLFVRRMNFRNAQAAVQSFDDVGFTYYRRATELLWTLVTDFPEDAYYQEELAIALGEAGNMYLRRGRAVDAEKELKSSLSIYESVANRVPDRSAYEMFAASYALDLIRSLTIQNKYDEARQTVERVLRRPHKEVLTLGGYAFGRTRLEREMVAASNEIVVFVTDAQTSPSGETDDESVIRSASEPETVSGKEQQLAAKRALLKGVIDLVTRWAPNEPGLSNIAKLLSAAPVELRDPALALQLANHAYETMPKEEKSRQALGWVLFANRDCKGAIEQLGDGDLESSFVLAMAHWQLGNHDEARKCFERGCEWFKHGAAMDPTNQDWSPRPLAMHQRLKDEAKKMLGIAADAAETAIETSAAIDPRANEARRFDAYRYFIANKPQDYRVHTRFAWKLCTTEFEDLRNSDEALRCAEKSLLLNPESRGARESLCAALYRLRRFEDSLKIYDDLLALEKRKGAGRADIGFFAAMSFWRLGQYDKARETYDRASKAADPKSKTSLLIRAEAESVLGMTHTSAKSSTPHPPEP